MSGTVDRVLDRALKIRVGEGPKVAFMAFYAANAIGAVAVHPGRKGGHAGQGEATRLDHADRRQPGERIPLIRSCRMTSTRRVPSGQYV